MKTKDIEQTILENNLKFKLLNKYKTYYFYINDRDYMKFKIDGGMFGGDYLWFQALDKYDIWQSHGLPLGDYTDWGKSLDIQDDIVYWVHKKGVNKKELKEFLKERFNIIGK